MAKGIQPKIKPENYWVIRWNAKMKDKHGKEELLSSRIFQTFLSRPEPLQLFEAYGFNKERIIPLFNKVKKGDHVFCYQIDEEKYVGLCEVKYKRKRAPGGQCLMLAKIQNLHLVKKLAAGSIKKLSRKKAEELLNNERNQL